MNVELFEKENLGQIRVIGDHNNPLFCLNDVCKILDIQRTSNLKNSLRNEFVGDDTYLICSISDSMGREQKMNFITEPQLYFLIMRSDKDNAKTFRQWIFNEVLPTIRKTGRFAAKQEVQKDAMINTLDNLAEITTLLKKMTKVTKNIENLEKQIRSEHKKLAALMGLFQQKSVISDEVLAPLIKNYEE